jgi:cytoskeletal protein RodZ
MLETTQVFTVLAGLLTLGIFVCWILYNSKFITQKKLANTCEFSKIKETESNKEESKIIQTRDKTAQKESKAIQTETKTVQMESKVIQTKTAQKESKAIQTETGKTFQTESKVFQTKIVKKESKAIQTGQLKFTERMTNFDTEQIDSAELFDDCCEICLPMLEKEAVGFCKNCEKNYVSKLLQTS